MPASPKPDRASSSKPRWRPVFLRAVILVMGLWAAALLWADEEQELQKVRRELQALNRQLQEIQAEQSEVENQKRKQELELSALYRSIYQIDRDINLAEQRLTQLNTEQNDLQNQRRNQQRALASDLRAFYISGRQESVKFLLHQRDAANFSRMSHYYGYFVRARASRLESYKDTLALLDENRARTQAQQARLNELSAELDIQQASLTASLARRNRLLTQIASRLQSAENRIAQRRHDEARLEKLIRDAIERITRLKPPASFTPFATHKGQFNWPVKGSLTQAFGAARGGDLRSQGIVIGAEEGQDVKSIHHGRVLFADYMRGYGLLVIVDHNDGFMTLYGNNQSIFVELGEWVAPGQAIAQVGKTGALPDPALYFEVRQQGQAQNPSTWLKASK